MPAKKKGSQRGSGEAMAPMGARVYDLTQFGAAGDGAALNTKSIQRALDAAAKSGGGTVYAPPGDYVTGTIHLRGNVTLWLEAGATIWGSRDRADYEQGCLIYAENAKNAAIRGRGAIDGNGEAFWRRERGRLYMGEWHPDPNAGEKWIPAEWRPARLMRLVRCDHLLLEDITIRNSPAWTVHLVDCDDVDIRGISILNGIYENEGLNTDGIDPDGCSNVRISGCFLQTGDDSIVLKISNRPGGRRVCRDITVTNCVLISMCTAIKIGSETHGEFRNIAISNCVVKDAGNGIGLWMRDGGVIDGVLINNIAMTLKAGGEPIYIWSWPRNETTPHGIIRNVTISNVTADGGGCAFISGTAESPVENVALDNVRFFMRGEYDKPFHADPPHPLKVWGFREAAYDVFCRYAKNLALRNLALTWNSPEQPKWGSAIRCRDVNGLEINGFVGRASANSNAATIQLERVANALIHNCRATEGSGAFLKIGEGAKNVSLMNNDLALARKAVVGHTGLGAGEMFEGGNRKPKNRKPRETKA